MNTIPYNSNESSLKLLISKKKNIFTKIINRQMIKEQKRIKDKINEINENTAQLKEYNIFFTGGEGKLSTLKKEEYNEHTDTTINKSNKVRRIHKIIQKKFLINRKNSENIK